SSPWTIAMATPGTPLDARALWTSSSSWTMASCTWARETAVVPATGVALCASARWPPVTAVAAASRPPAWRRARRRERRDVAEKVVLEAGRKVRRMLEQLLVNRRSGTWTAVGQRPCPGHDRGEAAGDASRTIRRPHAPFA